MNVVTHSEGKVARPLRVLVPLIKEDLKEATEASERAGMPYYRAAGEKMLEAKGQMNHGEFVPWIKRNFNLSRQHAARYMRFARATTDGEMSRYETFSDYMREDGGDPGYGKVIRKQPWHDPVKQAIGRVNINSYKQDQMNREAERALQRKLGLSLIEIGYRALAAKLHPDKGGPKDAMARLNQVRDRLKSHA